MAWCRWGVAIGLASGCLVAFPAWADAVWRSFGNDAVGATLVDMVRDGDRLTVRVEVENLSEGDRLFVHHAPEERDPQTYTFLPPRNRQAPSTDFRQLAPLATASWQVSFFLPKGTRPGLLVLGEARSPYRQAAILLEGHEGAPPRIASEEAGPLVPPLPTGRGRPTGLPVPSRAALTFSGQPAANRPTTPGKPAVAATQVPLATPVPQIIPTRRPDKPDAKPSAGPTRVAVRTPESPRPLSAPRPRPTMSPAPGEIAYISLSGVARKARLPRPTVQPAPVPQGPAQPVVSSPQPSVAMLPALPAGDRYVAAMRPGYRAVGDLLVLRLGLAPAGRSAGFGWRRIRAEEPGLLLEDIAAAVDAPDLVAVNGRSWLLARELGERWVVVQTDELLVVAARQATREDLRVWTGPGGPYARVLQGNRP
ncbi:MAG: hypothetical protein VKP57_12660 [Candidatus Sericytochromatia bacterium]|nr:hypothetical protein [Candidatus Sericytochromatia bacterium]